MLQGTCIFRRKNPPPLYSKKQTGPFRPELKEEHYLYILEDNMHCRPQGDIQVILATDVEGIGTTIILVFKIVFFTLFFQAICSILLRQHVYSCCVACGI